MHDPLCPYGPAAERLPQRLMAQAYAQHGYRRIQGSEQFNAYAGFGRRARAWRNHHARRRQRPNLFDASLVVSAYCDVRAQLTQELDEIESERIVIVDYQ